MNTFLLLLTGFFLFGGTSYHSTNIRTMTLQNKTKIQAKTIANIGLCQCCCACRLALRNSQDCVFSCAHITDHECHFALNMHYIFYGDCDEKSSFKTRNENGINTESTQCRQWVLRRQMKQSFSCQNGLSTFAPMFMAVMMMRVMIS